MELPLIKLENVWKKYQMGKIELVLRGVSLEIPKNSFTVIMGASGSGKSTLLHIISCLDTPTSGDVFLDGQNVSKLSQDQLAEIRSKKIGFIFQQFNLLSHLNAFENVAFPMVFQKIKEAERKKRAENILASVGLAERILHKPTELSGGQQQRVAIARALANNPEIIVADEPTGNVDSKTAKQIMEILFELHKKEKRTIIVVTHDPEIASYAENVIHIKDGEIL
jgi:putative ABC transport system ATP-binding protein